MNSTRRLLLVRHGQTTWNVAHRLTSRTDVPLTDLGERQAADLGRSLADARIDCIVASPLARAHRTAEIIGAARSQFDVRLDSRLVEVDCGPFEGLTDDEMAHGPLAAEVDAWQTGAIVPPGAERNETAAVRAAAFLDDVGPGTTLVVSHGQFIRILLAGCVLGMPVNDAVHRMKILNCHVAIVELRTKRGPRLLALNARSA
jgi:broad specificity phosphatase PhoE